jgi:serine/threonine-protein kinase LegK1
MPKNKHGSYVHAVENYKGHRIWAGLNYASVGAKYSAFTFNKSSKKNPGKALAIFSRSDKLGKGSFGTVYSIAPYQMDYKLRKLQIINKERVVKVFYNFDENDKENIKKEYLLMKAAGHLGVKEPVFNCYDSALLVMKFIPGQELDTLIDDGIIEGLERNIKIQVAYHLLLSLKKQVIDKDIIHRDIKPANIKLQLTPELKVNILDYGLARMKDNDDFKAAGTPVFAAPEIFLSRSYVASDIFSMGRVLSLIFLDNHSAYFKRHFVNCNRFTYAKDAITAASGLKLSSEPFIEDLLKRMLDKDAKRRATIDELIDAFEKEFKDILGLNKPSQELSKGSKKQGTFFYPTMPRVDENNDKIISSCPF